MNSNRTPPVFEDFDACHEMARATAISLRATGRAARLVSGYFCPDTSPASWDYRWQALAARFGTEHGFIHYWVEVDDRIIDPAVRQFGYTPPLETHLDDPRYRRTPGSYLAT